MDIFTALADPTRRQMLDRLLAREHAAGELVDAFPELSQPAISRHLRVLREAGFVQMRVDAQRRIYSLRPDAFQELTSWLARYQRFWPQALDALARHLDAAASQTATAQPAAARSEAARSEAAQSDAARSGAKRQTTKPTKQSGRKRPGSRENRR